jgi:hypothetical protein
MNPAENIEQQIQNLNFQTTPALDSRILIDATDRLEQNQTHPAEAQTVAAGFWRHIMKSKITKLVAAAAVVIAVLMVVFSQSGEIDLATPAFGDVLQQIYKARSVVFNRTFQNGQKEPFTDKYMILENGVQRVEMPFGNIMIFDKSSGRDVHLVSAIKEAIITQRVNQPAKRGLLNYLDWLQNAHRDSGRYIGQEDVDGRPSNVFVIEKTNETTTFWVDPDSDLPVRVKKIRHPEPTNRILGLSEKDFGGSPNFGMSMGDIVEDMTIIDDDFEWDVALDPSLFSLAPPEDYTVKENQFDVAAPAETDLVQSLAFWADMSSRQFPSTLDALGDPETIKPMLIERFNGDGEPREEITQAMNQWNILLKGFQFAKEMETRGDFHYAGDQVRYGDVNAPLCWWNKNDDSGKYRMIYGDLRIEDIAPENLPK